MTLKPLWLENTWFAHSRTYVSEAREGIFLGFETSRRILGPSNTKKGKGKAMKKYSPCKGCEDRHIGCHSTCEKYAEYAALQNKRLKTNNEQKTIDYTLRDIGKRKWISVRNQSRK